jgi:hypothetical protein
VEGLEDKSARVPGKKLYIIVIPTNFRFGDFDVQWKKLDKNALQFSGSEIFSFDSTQTAIFRALFGQVRDGFKESV